MGVGAGRDVQPATGYGRGGQYQRLYTRYGSGMVQYDIGTNVGTLVRWYIMLC